MSLIDVTGKVSPGDPRFDSPVDTYINYEIGLVVMHNMPCPVYPDRHAVYHCGSGHFKPSARAHAEGWRLIRVNKKHKWLQRLFIKLCVEK